MDCRPDCSGTTRVFVPTKNTFIRILEAGGKVWAIFKAAQCGLKLCQARQHLGLLNELHSTTSAV